MMRARGVETTITWSAMLQMARSVHSAKLRKRISRSRDCSSANGEFTSRTMGTRSIRATSTPVKLNSEYRS